MSTVTSRNKAKPDPSSPDVDSSRTNSTTNHYQYYAESPPRTHPTPASTPRSSSNPAIILARKLCASRNSQNEQEGRVLVIFFNDLIAGTILAIFCLFILIIMDYNNIIYLGSARAFRKVAYEMMTDPETIKYVEESLEMKFLSVDVYTAMTEELSELQKTLEQKEDEKIEYYKKDEERKKTLDSMRPEYDELLGKSGLDKFCEECKWRGATSCFERMNHFMTKYGDSEIKAKVALLELDSCRKA